MSTGLQTNIHNSEHRTACLRITVRLECCLSELRPQPVTKESLKPWRTSLFG